MLLIVDNCEHVHATASALVDRILRDAPGVRILATSRESLGVPGEAVIRVPGLTQRAADGSPGSAVRLFVDRGMRSPTRMDRVRADVTCRRSIGSASASTASRSVSNWRPGVCAA